MSLTGSGLWWCCVVFTLAAFAGVVWAWPRLAHRSPLNLAARAGSLLLVNVLVLLTAAIQLNDSYLFFAGWGDLQSAFTGNVSSTQLSRGTTAAAAASYHLPGQSGVTTASRRLPRIPAKDIGPNGVVTFTVKGQASGLRGSVEVQLPPGYNQRSNRTYPVLETFGGYPGTPAQWISVMDLGGVLQQENAAGRIRNAIVVSPQDQFPQGVDAECMNSSSGQVETWLAQDVPDFLVRTLHVSLARSAWATIGLSAGGYCAAMVAMHHASQYAASVVMGGYFRPELGESKKPLSLRSGLGRKYDLIRQAGKTPVPIAMWVETSHSDAISYDSTTHLLRAVKAPMAVHAVVLRNAGHWIGLWQELLPGALEWLGANVPGFHP